MAALAVGENGGGTFSFDVTASARHTAFDAFSRLKIIIAIAEGVDTVRRNRYCYPASTTGYHWRAVTRNF
jgi:hypothetical protein